MVHTHTSDFETRLLRATERTSTDKTLFREGSLECHFSPAFDHIETGASLVLVGITPGAAQHVNASRVLEKELATGIPAAVAARRAKYAGSFSGPLRGNLIAMLDHVGAHRALGLSSCAEIFDPGRRGVVHFTSALRHPVFVNGANYNGSPGMLGSPALLRMIETCLAQEARALPDALWLPLGPKPLKALLHLASLGVLPADRILPPLPHPGGANAERIAYFLGRKRREALSAKTLPGPIEQTRAELTRHFAALAWQSDRT